MNFVDCRSSTWKTTARLRSRPRRPRWSAGDRAQPLDRIGQRRRRCARPSAIASFIVRSKIEMRRSSLLRK